MKILYLDYYSIIGVYNFIFNILNNLKILKSDVKFKFYILFAFILFIIIFKG